MIEKAFVYILRCSDDTLYCGWTNDPIKRLHDHNTSSHGAKYTKMRRPVEMVYLEQVKDKREALKREFKIKHLPRDKKLKLLVSYKNMLKGRDISSLDLP